MALHPVSRFVGRVGAMHQWMAVWQSGMGTRVLWDNFQAAFYSPVHFPKFLLGSMMLSGLGGYYSMEYLKQQGLLTSLTWIPAKQGKGIYQLSMETVEFSNILLNVFGALRHGMLNSAFRHFSLEKAEGQPETAS